MGSRFEPVLPLPIDDVVERFTADPAFAEAMARSISGQDQIDVLLVVTEVRVRRRRHSMDLDRLAAALRDVGASERAVRRLAAFYSVQFLLDVDEPDIPAHTRQAAMRIRNWNRRDTPPGLDALLLLSAYDDSPRPRE